MPGPPSYPSAPPGYPMPAYPSATHPMASGNALTDLAFGGMTPETARADGEEGPRLPIRQSRFQMFLLAGVSAVALAAAAIVVWYKVTHKGDTVPQDLVSRFKEVNLAFEPPPSPWTRDEETRGETLGSPYILVYKRDNPEAHMAFGAKDYDPRSPRESELQNGLTQALAKLLDMSTIKQSDPLEHTWMGHDVKGFTFRAQLKLGTAVQGEAYRFAYKGIGYWFLSWTGDNNIFEEMQPSFAEARRHCKLLDLRKDWKAKQSATVPFKGERLGYTILDAEGVWEEEKDESNLKYEGEAADKLLKIPPGKIKPGKKKDQLQDATLIVYVLPGTGDPITEARQFITDKRAKEVKTGGDYQIEFVEITGAPEGDPITNPVENPLPVLRLQSIVKGAKDQNRFHVISAAKIGDKIVVVHAYTSGERETLEALFIQIASSLH